MKKIIFAFFLGVTIMFAATVFALTTSFKDVSNTDWFYQDVMNMASWDVIRGYPDGSFGPENIVNRAELSAIINRYDKARLDKIAGIFSQGLKFSAEDHIVTELKVALLQNALYKNGLYEFKPDCMGILAPDINMRTMYSQLESLGTDPGFYKEQLQNILDYMDNNYHICLSNIE
jgi:hypothetical protein